LIEFWLLKILKQHLILALLVINFSNWLAHPDSRIQNKRGNKEYIVGQRKQILGMGVSKYPETSKSLRERVREREKAMGGTNNFWSCSLAA
jgi:hypothetical protein